MTQTYLKDLTYRVTGAAIEVHRALGPGLLESVYLKCLAYELSCRSIPFSSEMMVPVVYKGLEMDTRLRCDLYIENCLVVEVKAQKEILPVHEAQILTYMGLLTAPKGIIFNFFCYNLFAEGQKTFVNKYFEQLLYS